MQKPEAGCGAAILDGQGRLLLIQRLREPEAGAWGLPGGKSGKNSALSRREPTRRLFLCFAGISEFTAMLTYNWRKS